VLQSLLKYCKRTKNIMTKAFAFDLFGILVDLGSVSKVFSKVSIKIDNHLFAAYLTIE
jgi:hypothetical protein